MHAGLWVCSDNVKNWSYRFRPRNIVRRLSCSSETLARGLLISAGGQRNHTIVSVERQRATRTSSVALLRLSSCLFPGELKWRLGGQPSSVCVQGTKRPYLAGDQ